MNVGFYLGSSQVGLLPPPAPTKACGKSRIVSLLSVFVCLLFALQVLGIRVVEVGWGLGGPGGFSSSGAFARVAMACRCGRLQAMALPSNLQRPLAGNVIP